MMIIDSYRFGGATTYPVYDYAYDFTNGLQRFKLADQAVNTAIESGEFTVLMAYNPDSFNATDTVLQMWNAGNSDRAFWFRFRSSGSVVQAVTSANGTSTAGITSASHGMSTGNWYFWACVVSMSESAQNDKIKLYRNATDVSATVTTGAHSSIHSVTFDNTNDTTIDDTSYAWGGRDSIGDSLDGFSHELTILDTPLSAAQISAIYNSGTPISPRESHNANVVCRPEMDTMAWDGTDYNADCEILGSGKIVGYNTVNGDLSSTGGIY